MSRCLTTITPGSEVPTVDYHMHTTFSDGESSIEDYVVAAESNKLTEIAFTDHVWRSSDWVDRYVQAIAEIRRETDIVVHAGVEAKVIDDRGRVDISPDDVASLDFVMGVVHRYQPNNEPPKDDILNFEPMDAARREKNLTISLLENDIVDVVGHPSRTYYKFFFGNQTTEPFPAKFYQSMIKRSLETETPLEYNARLPANVRGQLLELFRESDLPITIGSDAHVADRLSNLDHEEIRNAYQ